MNKNKQLEDQCVNLLKAINILDNVESYKVSRLADELADILSNKTTKLADRYCYTPHEIEEVLKRA